MSAEKHHRPEASAPSQCQPLDATGAGKMAQELPWTGGDPTLCPAACCAAEEPSPSFYEPDSLITSPLPSETSLHTPCFASSGSKKGWM